MKKDFLIYTFLILFIGPNAFAIDFEDGLYPELVTSSRALALGNAYVAKADDSGAVFYNPAGLGSVRGWKFHMATHMEFSKTWIKAGTSGKLMDIFGKVTKMFSLNGIRQLIVDSPDKQVTSRFSIMPNFTTKYFSTGFLYTMLTRAQVNSTTDMFEYADRADYGPYAALNLSLFGGIVKFGTTVAILRRSEVKGEILRITEIDLDADAYSKGIHLNVTAGTKITLPIATLPTFAAKMHNGLQSEFGSAAGAGAPEKIKSSIDVAFSMTPKLGKITRLHLELDWKDLTDEYSLSTIRKITLGMELDIARTLFFRLGYSDGFGSMGIGIRTNRLEVDLTTYARDLTEGTFQGTEDRRFALTLATGI